jgi:predicted ATPase
MERLDAAQAVCVPAIELFVERAGASSEQFRFRDADVDGVAELCRRLDGLPLAIELAATRIGDFGIGELIRQLDHGFHRLTGRRAGPERHRSLSAMLDWSHKRLSPQECALLRAASMLGGDFEPADAALVADVPQAETAQSLRRLVAKSLVVADGDSDGDAEGDCDGHAERPRYRLLETTRRYYRDHRAGS